jgi:hypothetical protein
LIEFRYLAERDPVLGDVGLRHLFASSVPNIIADNLLDRRKGRDYVARGTDALLYLSTSNRFVYSDYNSMYSDYRV